MWPTIEISDDGYWIINGIKTEYIAIGKDGSDGQDGTNGVDGLTPTIEISDDGYWIINGEKTNVLANNDENPQGLDFWLRDDGCYAVSVGKAKYLSHIEIPSTYLGRPIVEIEDEGFMNCTALISVKIPDSVTNIGFGAFYGCYSLLSVTIPKSITSIEYEAFGECVSLFEVCNKSSLDIVAGTVSGGGMELVFHGKVGLYAKHIISDESQTALRTVNDCIFFDNGVDAYLMKYIGKGGAIELPKLEGKEYEIFENAFRENANVTNVTIPDCVTKIGRSVFMNCTSLESVIIGNSVKEIGTAAFYNCEALESVIIGNSVNAIYGSVFQNCESLTKINIPDSVTTMGGYVFSNCRSLRKIVIPDSVKVLLGAAFENCGSDLTVYCEASSMPQGWYFPFDKSGCSVVWGYNGE